MARRNEVGIFLIGVGAGVIIAIMIAQSLGVI